MFYINTRTTLSIVILLFININISKGEISVDVDPNMPLWKYGFSYRTEVNAYLDFTNVNLDLIRKNGNPAIGRQGTALLYTGAMVYDTEALDNSNSAGGSALRHYGKTDVTRHDVDPLMIKAYAGFWEIWGSRVTGIWGSGLPEEFSDDFEVVERSASDNYIIIQQKSGSRLNGELFTRGLNTINEKLEGLQDQNFLLTWDRMASIRKNKIRVDIPKTENGKLVPDKQARIEPLIGQVIARESKLLYEALLGNQTNRADGETWAVDGTYFQGLIHPGIEGFFSGIAIVQAENGVYESPKLGKVRGIKLSLIPSGTINGTYSYSTLNISFNTIKNDYVQLPLVQDVTGYILLDTENQVVREGVIELKKGAYDGPLPKIGKLNDDITGKVNGNLSFILQYIQSISKTEY